MRRLVFVLTLVLLAGACASSKSTNESSNTTTPASLPHKAGMGAGVTAKQINLGVVLIDFKCIPTDFVDFEEPDQQKAYDAFINDINAKGGINGRILHPVYKTICPLNPQNALDACTAFADDDNVFAVLGDFGDPTGGAPLCMTKTKHRVLLTYEVTQEMENKAPPGLLLTPDITPDRKVKVVMALLKSQHILDGKTVAILGSSDANEEINKAIEPGLKGLNVNRGSTGIITVTSTDTTAAQQQLDGFIEKWRTEGVNALVLAGTSVEQRPFVDKIRKEFPNITLVSDSTAPLDAAQAEVKDHVTPNAFTGLITAEGRTGASHAMTPHFKQCKAIFEAQTHITVPSPNDVIKLPDGRKNNIYGEEEDACVFVKMFATIAAKVGADLNNQNWTTTVNNYGPIDIQSTDWASLHTGKYDADDTYGLVAFDPTIPKSGDWKRVTPVENVGNTG